VHYAPSLMEMMRTMNLSHNAADATRVGTQE
jgi:hypothetical protein